MSPIMLYAVNSFQMMKYPIGSMTVLYCQAQEDKKSIFIGTMYRSGERLLNCSIKKTSKTVYQIAWNLDCIFEVCFVKAQYH